jgi:hypothetical protein
MKRIVVSMVMGAAMLIATAPKAEAALILAFGQNVGGSPITGTVNGAQTITTITGVNVPISITFIENGVPVAALFSLTATSSGAAQIILGNAAQNFGGTFCISSGAGCTGTNYLSGTFTDATFGTIGGSQLTMGATEPPDSVTFASSIITSLSLGRALALSFTNVVPAVGICGTTICAFTGAVSGNFSANIGQVPEPGSMMLLGTGLLGLAAVARRRIAKKS